MLVQPSPRPVADDARSGPDGDDADLPEERLPMTSRRHRHAELRRDATGELLRSRTCPVDELEDASRRDQVPVVSTRHREDARRTVSPREHGHQAGFTRRIESGRFDDARRERRPLLVGEREHGAHRCREDAVVGELRDGCDLLLRHQRRRTHGDQHLGRVVGHLVLSNHEPLVDDVAPPMLRRLDDAADGHDPRVPPCPPDQRHVADLDLRGVLRTPPPDLVELGQRFIDAVVPRVRLEDPLSHHVTPSANRRTECGSPTDASADASPRPVPPTVSHPVIRLDRIRDPARRCRSDGKQLFSPFRNARLTRPRTRGHAAHAADGTVSSPVTAAVMSACRCSKSS